MNLEERWVSFSKRDQIGHIAAEAARGALAKARGDKPLVRQIAERALALIDLTLDDPKWRANISQVLRLRDEIARIWADDPGASFDFLRRVL